MVNIGRYNPNEPQSFNLQKLEDMLRKHVEFWKHQDLDNIFAWQLPEDYESSPIWYHIARGLELKGLLFSISKQELLRSKYPGCELLVHQCEPQTQKLGKKVEKVTAILDLEALGLRHLWKPGINYGGEVPRSYHRGEQVGMQYEHKVCVGRGSSQQVENEILFPGCVLRWQFASHGGDIGFGVFLKTKIGEWLKAGEMTEVLPSQHYNAHLVPTCLKAGVYVLRFDNTYSLIHSKHVSYTMEVLPPDQAFMEKVEKF
ncbi:LOW QUALITY PROTEIN: putative SEC14-like protein 6 [Erethizon dorsatum]